MKAPTPTPPNSDRAADLVENARTSATNMGNSDQKPRSKMWSYLLSVVYEGLSKHTKYNTHICQVNGIAGGKTIQTP